jgi:DNA-binding response OmpR family regulator
MEKPVPAINQMERILRTHSLKDDPFELFEADTETSFLPYTFVARPYFFEILGSPDRPKPSFLLSEKGEGKTATRLMVAYTCLQGNSGQVAFPVSYTDFDYVLDLAGSAQKVKLQHHIAGIVRSTIRELVFYSDRAEDWRRLGIPLERRVLNWGKLAPFYAGLLSSMAATYADHITRLRLPEFLNTEPASVDWEKMTGQETLSFLGEIVSQIAQGPSNLFKSLYILVDRADEIPGGIDATLSLLMPLISSGPMLNVKKVGLKFFLLKQPGSLAISLMPTSPERLVIQEIDWDIESLKKVVNQRLFYYSDQVVNSFQQLCHVAVRHNILERAIEYSGESPRRLLRFCRLLLKIRASRPGNETLIDRNDLVDALDAFQKEREWGNGAVTVMAGGETNFPTEPHESLPEPATPTVRSQRVRIDETHVWIDEQLLEKPLPEKEMQLLEMLYKTAPNILGEDILITCLWGDKPADQRARNNLRKLIGRLREDISHHLDESKGEILLNVRGRGYLLKK